MERKSNAVKSTVDFMATPAEFRLCDTSCESLAVQVDEIAQREAAESINS